MKVLHLCNDFFNTTLYRSFLSSLADAGNDDLESDFVVLTNVNENHGEMDHVIVNKVFRRNDRYIYGHKIRKSFNSVLESVDIGSYSVIHAHFLFSNGGVALHLRKKFGIPYIVAVRNTDVNIFFKYLIHLRKIGLRIILGAERIVFLSPAYRDFVINKYVAPKYRESVYKKCLIIPNGIDEYWFQNLALPKREITQITIRLLQIGDISKNKNVETTVKAVQLLADQGLDIRLDVAGKIVDQSVYNSIKNLKFVNYLGFKNKEQLLKIFRENDLFVLPSINETFGLVYAEAMSQGLPVIYTKGQGFDGHFVDGKIGYSVDALDYHDVAEKILLALSNIVELSNNCVQLCKKFQWSSITGKYDNLYRVIVAERSETKYL